MKDRWGEINIKTKNSGISMKSLKSDYLLCYATILGNNNKKLLSFVSFSIDFGSVCLK